MTDYQPELTDDQPSFQCRHILTDGHRCGSPTLRHEHFCYYHHTTRKPVPKQELDARDQRKARRAAFALPRPDDRSAIQAAIGEILLRLAANQLDPRRAGLLLYGLQIASINLPPRQPAQDPAATVEEVEIHPEHGLIAPEQDFATRPTPGKQGKSLEQILMEDWAREEQREAEREREAPKPFILDDLNAAAAEQPRRVPHSSQPHRDEWVSGKARPLSSLTKRSVILGEAGRALCGLHSRRTPKASASPKSSGPLSPDSPSSPDSHEHSRNPRIPKPVHPLNHPQRFLLTLFQSQADTHALIGREAEPYAYRNPPSLPHPRPLSPRSPIQI